MKVEEFVSKVEDLGYFTSVLGKFVTIYEDEDHTKFVGETRFIYQTALVKDDLELLNLMYGYISTPCDER